MYDLNGERASCQIDGGSAIVAFEGGPEVVESPPALAEHPMQVPPPSNQLTLSFHGEVYVFDSVPPERVQAVLLLLGGQELPSTFAAMPLDVNHRLSNDRPRPSNNPQRMASIMRYREKRKKLRFDKRVLYSVRQDVASRMNRRKGQFASSRASEEAVSPSSSSDGGQSQEKAIASFCQNCGTAKGATPMMRRGPAGPKSMCNACGLLWANKGILRSHSQPLSSGIQNSSSNRSEESDGNDSDIGTAGHVFSAMSNGPESLLIASIDASMAYPDG